MRLLQFLGGQLRDAREARGLSIFAAAQDADLSVEELTAYEEGQQAPGLEAAVRLAEAYEVSLKDITDFRAHGWVLRVTKDGEAELLTRKEAERLDSKDGGGAGPGAGQS
jgi:transcriptional regulator with XRE-family HTH domain